MPSLTQFKFGEFLALLRERGYNEEADNYVVAACVECVLQGIDGPLDLTVKKVLEMFQTPPDDPGWDTSVPGRPFFE